MILKEIKFVILIYYYEVLIKLQNRLENFINYFI